MAAGYKVTVLRDRSEKVAYAVSFGAAIPTAGRARRFPRGKRRLRARQQLRGCTVDLPDTDTADPDGSHQVVDADAHSAKGLQLRIVPETCQFIVESGVHIAVGCSLSIPNIPALTSPPQHPGVHQTTEDAPDETC